MGLFCPFLCTVVVYCIGSKLCSLGSVVDNSGREQWNSWPEECSLLRCSAGQRRADGLSFYPRVMWSIKPAAVLPWMGRHTPAHLNLSTFILLPSFTDCNSNRFVLITASLAIWPHKYLFTGCLFWMSPFKNNRRMTITVCVQRILVAVAPKASLNLLLGAGWAFLWDRDVWACHLLPRMGRPERLPTLHPHPTFIFEIEFKETRRSKGELEVKPAIFRSSSVKCLFEHQLCFSWGKNRIYSCGS